MFQKMYLVTKCVKIGLLTLSFTQILRSNRAEKGEQVISLGFGYKLEFAILSRFSLVDVSY